jgi:hypothetical protein
LLEDLGNIFTVSAKKTFGTFNCKNIDSKINKNKNSQNQKLWFDQDCKFARQKYRKSKRRYKLNNTIRNRSIMIDDEKGYIENNTWQNPYHMPYHPEKPISSRGPLV